jgi:hypothetical protein
MTTRDSLVGRKFNSLMVIELDRSGKNRTYCICKCDCGKIKSIRASHLVSGQIKSCGCNRINKLPKGQSSFNRLLSSYKQSALKRGIDFDLSIDEFLNLINGSCHYCGKSPMIKILAPRLNGYILCNGVDRLDSSLGYKLDNCVPCCKRCNQGKNNMSLTEFKSWIETVYKNMENF